MTTAPVAPTPPVRTPMPPLDLKTKLRGNVFEALKALPFYFTSTINIEGLEATDLFSLNTLLGGAIEIQTVETLNRIRAVWDPDDEWEDYGFQRFPQSFPDVRLVKSGGGAPPALGIELKGWYLLSKEAEPSFRFTATAAACTPWDMIAVVPWSLTNVLSGAPRVHAPFVEQASYAADMRTYYWQHLRGGNAASRDNTIVMPPSATPYPQAGTSYSDRPMQDGGGNFGRVARVSGLMDGWKAESLDLPLAGIPARHWIKFLSVFSEATDPTSVSSRVEVLLQGQITKLTQDNAERVVTLLDEIGDLLT